MRCFKRSSFPCFYSFVFCLFLLASSSRAEWNATVTSEYQGEGIFEYTVQMHWGPIVQRMNQLGFGGAFTNRLSYVMTPICWDEDLTMTNYIQWMSACGEVASPVNEQFSAQSSETAWKLDQVFMVFNFDYPFSLCVEGGSGSGEGGLVYSLDVVGYAKFSALVPAIPDEADGSSLTQHVDSVTLLPGARIRNPQEYTLTIDSSYDCTIAIEASDDMRTWLHVAYVHGYAPSFTWISSVPLVDIGSYFRAHFVSGCHEDLESLQSGMEGYSFMMRPINAAKVLDLGVSNDTLKAIVQTVPGARYSAWLEVAGVDKQAVQHFVAEQSETSISFPMINASGPVFVRVERH